MPQESIGGNSTSRGVLEYSSGKFSATGQIASKSVDFKGWKTDALNAEYTYRYPEKQLNLTKRSSGGSGRDRRRNRLHSSRAGKTPHHTGLDYFDVDTAQLAQVYPWDQKYMIYSKAQGYLQGWFERDLTQYEFEGDSLLTSYSPEPCPASLPSRGRPVTFTIKPGERRSRVPTFAFSRQRFKPRERSWERSRISRSMSSSSNLETLKFLYPDANGKGSFKGTLKGPPKSRY